MAAPTAQNMEALASSDRMNTHNTPSGDKINLTMKQRDTAQYVTDMILELRNMARAAKLFNVMVPLEIAYYEAFSVAYRVIVPPEEIERLRQLSQAVRDSEEAAIQDC